MAKKKRESELRWEVLPVRDLRRRNGLHADSRPIIRLDPERVPELLRALIPLAERFGISDDVIRDDFFASKWPLNSK